MRNPTELRVAAPAKINLTLHVTGQRDDGYHLLDTLVAFATVHDRLIVSPSDTLDTLTVEGPEAAGVPADRSNFVSQAARLCGQTCHITLEKNLPAAAGIGGGSADAAAVLRAILALRHHKLHDPNLELVGSLRAMREQAVSLGADVPMCLTCETLRARGIGEDLHPVPLPDVPAVLINPRVAVSTPDVFRALSSKSNPPMPEDLPAIGTAGDLVRFLATQRNDLEAAARALVPEIDVVLAAVLAQPGCDLGRMSGSGATCFGLFDSVDAAQTAAVRLRRAHPDWWVAEGVIGNQSALAMPRA